MSLAEEGKTTLKNRAANSMEFKTGDYNLDCYHNNEKKEHWNLFDTFQSKKILERTSHLKKRSDQWLDQEIRYLEKMYTTFLLSIEKQKNCKDIPFLKNRFYFKHFPLLEKYLSNLHILDSKISEEKERKAIKEDYQFFNKNCRIPVLHSLNKMEDCAQCSCLNCLQSCVYEKTSCGQCQKQYPTHIEKCQSEFLFFKLQTKVEFLFYYISSLKGFRFSEITNKSVPIVINNPDESDSFSWQERNMKLIYILVRPSKKNIYYFIDDQGSIVILQYEKLIEKTPLDDKIHFSPNFLPIDQEEIPFVVGFFAQYLLPFYKKPISKYDYIFYEET